MRFKVGDKVKASRIGYARYSNQIGNSTYGTIKKLRYDAEMRAGLFPYYILWENGKENTYQDSDIEHLFNFSLINE